MTGVYFIYILQCTDGSLYTGITNDLSRRLEQHQSGKGGNYTRSRTVKRILYSEKAISRGAALKREAEIKKWRRDKKMALIRSSKPRA